ncbi:hypothetical protein ABPG72_003227 [Tetrahymena utriculariae]
MNRTIAWINKTEGRDKFCKAIQYASRFLKWHFTNTENKELATRFNGLFNGMKDARKLFRLFKTINEIQKIQELLNKKDNDEINKALNILVRAFFGLYWYFDNLVILKSVNFIKGDPKPDNKKGSTCWLIALLLSIAQNIRNLLKNFTEELNLSKQVFENQVEQENSKLNDQISKIRKQRVDIYLSIIKNLGDTITAGQASNLWPTLLNKNASDGLIGLGGFVSAVITSYQLY